MNTAYHLDPEWNDVDPLDLPPKERHPSEPVDHSLDGLFDSIEFQLGPSKAHEAYRTERFRLAGTGPWRERKVRVIRSQRVPK